MTDCAGRGVNGSFREPPATKRTGLLKRVECNRRQPGHPDPPVVLRGGQQLMEGLREKSVLREQGRAGSPRSGQGGAIRVWSSNRELRPGSYPSTHGILAMSAPGPGPGIAALLPPLAMSGSGPFSGSPPPPPRQAVSGGSMARRCLAQARAGVCRMRWFEAPGNCLRRQTAN